MKIAVLTVSDTVARGERADASGPAVVARCKELGWPVRLTERVADDASEIETLLKRLADEEGMDLILTTGGTGLGPRDVTPEATEAVCEKLLDGFGELMRAVSLKVVPTAILSRQIAGIRGKALIVTLPGKPSAIRDCLLAVFPAIPYCIDLIEGPYLTTNEALVKAFRPKS